METLSLHTIDFTFADLGNESKHLYSDDNVSGVFDDLYSGSTDNASGLRVIGSLLLGEADSLAHYQIAKRGEFFGTTEY